VKPTVERDVISDIVIHVLIVTPGFGRTHSRYGYTILRVGRRRFDHRCRIAESY
jgi:hypothetical protein